MVDAADASLHKPPEALDGVGMSVSLNVDPGFMVEAGR